MTVLNLNHFWKAQAELCLKGTFVNASFMFVTIFSDIYDNLTKKIFINLSFSKYPKIINWNKNDNFYFHTSLWCLRKASSFWGIKKKCENKKNLSSIIIIIHVKNLLNWHKKG